MAKAKYMTWNGMTKNMTEWAAYFGLSDPTFRSRLRDGVAFEDMRKKKRRGGKKRLIEWNGMTKDLSEWAAYFGLTMTTFCSRLRRSVPFDQITSPPRAKSTGRPRYLTWNGETKHLKGWAAHFGVSYETMYYRLKRGIPFEQVGDPIDTPHKGRPKGLKDKKPRKLRSDKPARTDKSKQVRP